MTVGLELIFRKARNAEKRGDEAEARRLLQGVLETYPNNATARQTLARLDRSQPAPSDLPAAEIQRLIAAHQRGDCAETIRLGEPLARRFPMIEGIQTLLGAARLQIGDYAGAEDAFRLAVHADPQNANCCNNLGVALKCQGKLADAERAFADATVRDPAYVDAHVNLAGVLEEQGKADETLKAYQAVISIAPDHVDALHKIAALHRAGKRYADAIEAYVAVLAVDPEHAASLHELGRVLLDVGHVERAIQTFRLSVRIDPDNASSHFHLGMGLAALGHPEEALFSFARTTELVPGNYSGWSQLLFTQARLCDWSTRAAMPMLPIQSDATGGSIIPFTALAFEDDPVRQRERSRVYGNANFRASEPAAVPFIAKPRAAGGKIRIGYFSADFYAHATMYLMAGLLREHDRDRFEIRVYDFGSFEDAAGRRAVDGLVDAFVDLRGMTDREAVDLARSHDLDIAIDLKGYTKDCRTGLFVERVAPVQISYLGYPGTLGGDFMDYLIADPIVIPNGAEGGYSERIIRLPGCYQPNDDRRPIANVQDDRASLGLPEDGFVFCCFNQSYKIGPREFDVWMQLLREIEGSVLWLLNCGQTAEANLRREASARGVDPARLIFAENRPHTDHLARQRHADLFIDTFAVNAHTTASDALWGGLPVLTLVGQQFAARVAASLVTAVGLPELAVTSEQAYVDKALELARSPEALAAVKARLAANRLSQPLFDTVGYTRHIEAAFETAHRRRIDGKAPDHIWIE